MADKTSHAAGADPAPENIALRPTSALSLQLDDDGEDFALAAMGISDSYHPSPAPTSQYRPASAQVDAPPIPRISSVTKDHHRHDSLTLRHDGSNGHDVASGYSGSSISALTNSSSSPLLNRNSTGSTLSASQITSTDDPYEGPRGPSHPYQMYPQNVRLTRTASLATTSTTPISEQSYSGPRGPAHPYTMYPQHTVSEPNIAEGSSPAPVPANVGFPGSADTYQRRIGPDGEDAADLIGPDGHTEQLPPYTRYPDEAYHRKALGVAAPPAQPTAAQTPQVDQTIPGAGGIGRATRNPEFSSTEDLGNDASPLSRQSVRSFTSETSQHEVNTAAMDTVNEKGTQRGWKQSARKRIWGVVPCWAAALAVLVLVLMGVVIGAVIGTVFGSKGNNPEQNPSASLAYPCDYEPIFTVPPGLPALITGNYGLPLMLSNTASQCVKNTTQAQAWNCDMIYSQLSINITAIPDQPANEAYGINFGHNDSFTMDNNVYTYGMQPPNLSNVTLQLVTDLFQDERGPAWFFQAEHVKTVIIPEELLYPSQVLTKRGGQPNSGSLSDDDNGFLRQKNAATHGDRPWICFWHKTVIESFIYVTQNNSLKAITNNASSTSSSSASSSVTPSPTVLRPPGDGGPIGSPLPTRPSESNDHMNKLYPSNSEAEPRRDRAAPMLHERAPSPAFESSNAATYSNMPKPGSMTPHPNVIKIIERRVPPNEDLGFCRQYEIKSPGGPATPILVGGKSIDIYLDETFASSPKGGRKARDVIESYLSDRSANSNESGMMPGSGTEMSECGCMWWLN
ncbi:hypothetical protein MN608_07301 [Microdochium nivale]|nr:hypothetical protein MN608_07301 [Microdochium nivale]